jgi:hypothetical protein
MAFVSEIFGEIHDDSTHWKFVKHIDANGVSESGYTARNYDDVPRGSIKNSREFPKELLIPRDQWKERIEEQQRKKIRPIDIINREAPKGWQNQHPTNSCWAFGSISQPLMIARLLAGLPFVELSPYSVSGPINGYRDVGGWGVNAINYAIEHGVASREFWPFGVPGTSTCARDNQNAIRCRQYFEPSRDNAAKYKPTDVIELTPRSNDEKMSACLQPIPWVIPSGYNRIGHQTTTIGGLVLPNGEFGFLDLDNYSSDGTPHLVTRTFNHGMADDQLCILAHSA